MSVRKRVRGGKPRYEVRWREGDRHRSRTFDPVDYGGSLKDAHLAARDFDAERARRQRMGAFAPVDPSADAFVSYARLWFDRDSGGWAKSTRLNRAHLLDKWIVPYVGGLPLRELGQPQVRDWRAAIEKAGAPTVTANRALSTLSACLGAAVRDGKLPYNPCSGVEKRRELVVRPRAALPDEVERIRAEMPSLRDATLVSLFAYAGLRPAEALALEWADIGDDLLVVDKSFTYGELRPTKTATRRMVDIVQPLREDLDALLGAQSRANEIHDLVAPNRAGRPLDLRTWRRRIWKPACERAGVSLTPYDLRHGYCSLLAHEGRSAPYIAAMLGHSLTDTQRHYAHIIDAARLAPGVSMVDAIMAARATDVRPRYARSARRHLQAVG